jgi:DIS3-like exonuclease 2 C terminal
MFCLASCSIASNCNKMKFAAKRAGEMSSEIYLSLYVDQLGQMLESAVVLEVKDHSFDVIVCSMGINQRIYVNVSTFLLSHQLITVHFPMSYQFFILFCPIFQSLIWKETLAQDVRNPDFSFTAITFEQYVL